MESVETRRIRAHTQEPAFAYAQFSQGRSANAVAVVREVLMAGSKSYPLFSLQTSDWEHFTPRRKTFC